MNSEQLLTLVQNTLEDSKGVDIAVMDVRKLTSIADYMVVASATSTRHAASMADKLSQAAKQHGAAPLSITGESDSEWVLIDLNDIIVHIMLADAREFYSLEKLWSVTETRIQTEK